MPASIASLALIVLAMTQAQASTVTGDRGDRAGHSLPQADAALVPSEASGDDCSVDAAIEVAPDAAMRDLHRRLCVGSVHPAFLARCAAQASALRSIRFVTDHCAGADEAVEVSLGGRAYHVRRTGPAPDRGAPMLAGRFSGDGLRMMVEPGKIVHEQIEDGERIGVRQEVAVELVLDGATRRFPAMYTDGP